MAKRFIVVTLSLLLISLCATSLSASLITLSPSSPLLVATGNQTSQNVIQQFIDDNYLNGSVELYKQDVGDADSGSFASEYTTTYFDTPLDPSRAEIRYTGITPIVGATHLLVKDGNSTPAWYLFDISGWDGEMDIDLMDFWPGGGAISHVAIYDVPEPATVLVWSMLVGMGFAYQRYRK